MKCSSLFKLLLVTLVVTAFAPRSVNADDAADRTERQFAELREQMQQMRVELEELRALLRESHAEREAVKPDLPPELQERLHAMKNRIQELMQAGRVDEANAVEREAAALMERFAAEHQHAHEAAATDIALPPEAAERLEQMKREIQELRAAGRLDAAEALEREARAMLEKVADAAAAEQDAAVPEPPKDGAGPEARLDHLRAAAEHLQAAGSLDLAERVRQQISELERERQE